ncbi:MAG: VacJ family lipoprotein [Deltaproteobacteria bacterium]|nr:VacJ family lipoprotein [Deltaproteobacteria bacterium]MBM4322061.1 VacJ family lipoprotein [Deltaproteobacteria bacterium]MBM4346506.1 VacJ family lipoprotein [Deltaproteobacteria bacterium]
MGTTEKYKIKIFLTGLLLCGLLIPMLPGPASGEPTASIGYSLDLLICSQPSGPPLLLAQSFGPSLKAEEPEFEEQVDTIPDPLEPVNRLFFNFNDRLYFWAYKPVASGYKIVVPEDVRLGIKNFFSNLTSPVRLVNCLLQANFKGAGNETIRLLLNSTLGLAGFLDPARTELGIEKREEDFGQTLGAWGMGPVFYVEWPFLGASSLRDAIGFTGDILLDPKTYLIKSMPVGLAIRTYDQVNDTSFRIGEYEDFKRNAIDPYIAKREAYHQYRKHKIKKR